jgi:hypothetical protein
MFQSTLCSGVISFKSSVSARATDLGYEKMSNPFRFEKKVASPIDEKEYTINLDFLAERARLNHVKV